MGIVNVVVVVVVVVGTFCVNEIANNTLDGYCACVKLINGENGQRNYPENDFKSGRVLRDCQYEASVNVRLVFEVRAEVGKCLLWWSLKLAIEERPAVVAVRFRLSSVFFFL